MICIYLLTWGRIYLGRCLSAAVTNFSSPFPRCCTFSCWRHRLWIIFFIFH